MRRAEFEAVYRGGQRRSSVRFVVFFLPNGLACSRFGSSVKRAQGGAVVRNRVRRRIREILRLHRQEIAPGWDVVIHPRLPEHLSTVPFAPLAQELIELLRVSLKRAASGPEPRA